MNEGYGQDRVQVGRGAPRESSPVDSALSNQRENLSRLESMVQRLTIKLATVLAPAPGDVPGKALHGTETISIRNSIDENSSRINMVSNTIDTLIDRLEV